ncbi:MAG: type II toxin-antitoxin system HipA family toxin [Alphaproteobacteria bacterium]|nr:type II toxin-antitoxin system HipA family toxin [Alphaproteobacteria bacterium]
MSSESKLTEAYVWIWLPDRTEPIVAGKLEQDGQNLIFAYGKSYLERQEAISIYEAELPLKAGTLPLLNGLSIPNCIRDGAPDAWGRRVIINRQMGLKGADIDPMQLNELTYLLRSGSDRIGALDFQQSATQYIPRQSMGATLIELMSSAERVEKGIPLSPELDLALYHGSSIGGARPKALIKDGETKYIAKFSGSSDTYSVVKAEFIAMRLAAMVGINVAPVKLTKAAHKDVLLIERFDRVLTNKGWQRKSIISALTILELDEMLARYASYEKLAEIIRTKFTSPKQTLKELFKRIIFNILSGNNDDHARNHAAFWDGKSLTLTPAYDICPQIRAGGETTQAMLIHGANRYSQLKVCVDASHIFHLSENEALNIIEYQKSIIEDNWNAICDQAELNQVDKNLFWHRQFLNPYAFEGLNA